MIPLRSTEAYLQVVYKRVTAGGKTSMYRSEVAPVREQYIGSGSTATVGIVGQVCYEVAQLDRIVAGFCLVRGNSAPQQPIYNRYAASYWNSSLIYIK